MISASKFRKRLLITARKWYHQCRSKIVATELHGNTNDRVKTYEL